MKHTRSPRGMSLADRLKRFSRRDASGCLLWISTVNSRTGYPQIFWEGKNQSAHRMAWIVANGPIPDGMKVCHRCDVRHCIDDAHLFLGTNTENMADMVSKGRAAKSLRNGNGKLTPSQIAEIIAAPKTRGSGRRLARQHGVSPTTISAVRRAVDEDAYR